MEIFLIWLDFVKLKPKEVSTALDLTRFESFLNRHPELVSGSRVLINKHVRP